MLWRRHEKELLLCGHLRHHFLPLIVTGIEPSFLGTSLSLHCFPVASVNTDMKFIQGKSCRIEWISIVLSAHCLLLDKDVRRYYPTASSYGEGAPCWSLLKGLTERLQSVISLALEILLLIRVLLQRDIFDRYSLGATACVFFLVLIYSPTNGVDGAGG